ncbi:TorF family putative porin [Novosphingobium soli]|uniref:TorF family putative porin n=1 Tax=Novosphingobium soli TaxID=574956 RepID=A0ABV6CYK1_9SPHN
MTSLFRKAAACCSGLLCAAAWAAPFWTSPALAQSAPLLTFEAETDRRERGLSWTDGKSTLGMSLAVPVTYDLSIDFDAFALRNSARHGGADAAVTIAPRYTIRSGGWDLDASVRGHVFVGRAGTSYVEVAGRVARTLGPVQVAAGAAFAPGQDAIGGSNLYVDGDVAAGIPGTPVTVYAGLGHTSGSGQDDPRAARLRPGGDYLDHHVGAEYAAARFAAGLRYSDTSIDRDEIDRASPWVDGHYGRRLVAYFRFTP